MSIEAFDLSIVVIAHRKTSDVLLFISFFLFFFFFNRPRIQCHWSSKNIEFIDSVQRSVKPTFFFKAIDVSFFSFISIILKYQKNCIRQDVPNALSPSSILEISRFTKIGTSLSRNHGRASWRLLQNLDTLRNYEA